MNEELNVELVKTIIDFCDDYGYNFRENYSGRCMYGEECVGVETAYMLETLGELFEYLNVERDFDISDLIEILLKNAKADTMGLNMIIYWPLLHMTDELYEMFDEECEDAE